MEKIKYIPLVLFTLAAGKSLFFGSSYESASVLFVLGVIACYYEFKSQDRRLEEFENYLDEQAKLVEDNKKELAEIRAHMSSYKLQTQFKQSKVL